MVSIASRRARCERCDSSRTTDLTRQPRDIVRAMSDTPAVATDLTTLVQDAGSNPKLRISTMAAGLVGSEILKIAAEIRGLVATGRSICDLTVGDFNPKHFPIPETLSHAVRTALEKGETNYPPSNGMPELRKAVARYYARELGLNYPESAVLILGG